MNIQTDQKSWSTGTLRSLNDKIHSTTTTTIIIIIIIIRFVKRQDVKRLPWR